MNQELITWIFGILITGGAGALVTVLKLHLGESRRQSDNNNAVDKRLVKMETLMEILMKSSAMSLHSPHTREYDELAKKYYHGELDNTDWKRFYELCIDAEKAENNSSEKRAMSYTLACLCAQKLGIELPKPSEHTIKYQSVGSHH